MPCPAIQVLEQQFKTLVLPRSARLLIIGDCATIAGSLAGGRDRAGDGAAYGPAGLRGCGAAAGGDTQSRSPVYRPII